MESQKLTDPECSTKTLRLQSGSLLYAPQASLKFITLIILARPRKPENPSIIESQAKTTHHDVASDEIQTGESRGDGAQTAQALPICFSPKKLEYILPL